MTTEANPNDPTRRAIRYGELAGYYFAYGANMHPDQIGARCVKPEFLELAFLSGYRLDFFGLSRTWDGGMETVVEDPNGIVWGALYKLSQSDWDRLDAWQDARIDGTGPYFHFPVRVTELDGSLRAVLIYKKDHLGAPQKPSSEFLDFIVRGAQARGLPEHYLEQLRQIPSQKATFPVPRSAQFDRGLLASANCLFGRGFPIVAEQ